MNMGRVSRTMTSVSQRGIFIFTGLSIALNALLDRFERIVPGQDRPVRRQSTVIRGFGSLPLRGYRA